MGVPPATPAPSRFLTAKRPGTQQSQTHTPNQNFTSGSHQFFATPRFASATPRPSSTQGRAAFATPALTVKPRASRTRSTQDIIDDSSPILPEEELPFASSTKRETLPEPIEFDSSLIPRSQSQDDFPDDRPPKRRRISIASSEPEAEPAVGLQPPEHDLGSLPDATDDHIVSYHSELDDEDEDDENEPEDYATISPTQSIASSPLKHRPSPGTNFKEDSDLENSDASPSYSDSEEPKPTLNKPTFHNAPRFRPTEPPDKFHAHPDTYLADIFSPQRRGAKYLPGGLAAELRDWLVDVKGGVDGEGEVKSTSVTFSFTSSAAVVRVVVDEVSRGGPGMTLISGRVVEGVGEAGCQKVVKAILAGEGNIEDLGVGRGGGNQSLVAPGAVVAVAPPAWDVELNGSWAVAYRWEVVEGPGWDAR